MFWSYLWGIEINVRLHILNITDGVLILPMRDWNDYEVEFVPEMYVSFDLTYEGLKYIRAPVLHN